MRCRSYKPLLLAAILSEARKFNLFVVLTQQYFSQVDKSLKDAIFANVYNYYCFRVAEEDAIQLVGNLPMELPKEMLSEAKRDGVKEETMKVRMLTDLHPRECIVRLAANGLLMPCFKARTLDVHNNVTRTFLTEGYTPKQYTGTPVTIEKFYEKAAMSVSDLPLPDPPPQQMQQEGAPQVQPPPPQTAGISLDEIMQSNSTKGNEEQS